uniref:Kunitz/Bovine pancreatic trypsin inhibitor domain protein n=1 Tax=Angiostrongylus cantonensis TaxID=6313 RepID=A0A0K0CYE1_ANGCA
MDGNQSIDQNTTGSGEHPEHLVYRSNCSRAGRSQSNQFDELESPSQAPPDPENIGDRAETHLWQHDQLQQYQFALDQELTEQSDQANGEADVQTKVLRSVQYDDQPKDCSAPKAEGSFCSTAPQKQMFYYNEMCQPFMFNGCDGNGNRFENADECRRLCVDSEMAVQEERGDMTACQAEYATEHLTPLECGAQDCPVGYQCTSGFCCPTPEFLCNLQYDSGKFAIGGEKSDRYFYTSQYKTCMKFSFYGSLGNANNFPDFNACMRTCSSQ